MRKTLVFGAMLLAAACGDSPTAPSAPSPAMPSAVTASGTITAVGVLYVYPTYRLSPSSPRYLIQGVGQNLGDRCVAEISGTTIIEGVPTSWSLRPTHRVTAGSQFWYEANVEVPTSVWANPAANRQVVNYTTTFRFSEVKECE